MIWKNPADHSQVAAFFIHSEQYRNAFPKIRILKPAKQNHPQVIGFLKYSGLRILTEEKTPSNKTTALTKNMNMDV